MGLKAILEGQDVLAYNHSRKDLVLASKSGNLTCPYCNGRMKFINGKIKIAHFSHLGNHDDCIGKPESQIHMRSKYNLHDLIKKYNPGFSDIEHQVNNRIYDIFFELKNGKKVGVEIQNSIITRSYLHEKLRDSTKENIHLLYILVQGKYLKDFPKTKGAKKGKIFESRVTDLEKRLHKLNYGQVYYTGSTHIMSGHFDKLYREVNAREWYDSDGNYRSAGGYSKLVKRSRKVKLFSLAQNVNLLKLSTKQNEGFKLASFSNKNFWS